MNIVVNTNYKSAGTKVCVDDMIPMLKTKGHFVEQNDWDNYQNYDVILFMSNDSQAIKAKKENPNAIVGIMDAKINNKGKKELSAADFLLVSSIEQKDTLLSFNKKIIIYYMFPNIPEKKKIHKAEHTTIIGYHGNKLHLNAFYPTISKAIEKISEKYNIELHIMYNKKKLGKWKESISGNIKIKHIQWSEENYEKQLSKCHIGIVNNLKPVKEKFIKIRIPAKVKNALGFKYNFVYTDILTRYKYNTNPGRIYVFSQLHLPVISDFVPSSVQLIKNEYSGLLAHSTEGWYNAIEQLITKPELRNKYSSNLKTIIDENYSINNNFENFNKYLIKLKNDKNSYK